MRQYDTNACRRWRIDELTKIKLQLRTRVHILINLSSHASLVCVICCAHLCIITSRGAVEPWRRRARESSQLTLKRLKWPSPLVNGHKRTYNTHCINTTQTCVNSTTTAIRRHFTDRNHLLLLFITMLMCHAWQNKENIGGENTICEWQQCNNCRYFTSVHS